MTEITKEYIANLTDKEKYDLAAFLISEGIDIVYVYWLIFDMDYNDVVKDKPKKV